MRYSRQDWLLLGLKQLALSGASGLTVDSLCIVAGRSKGSFYHHFKNHAEYVAALLEHWKHAFTEKIIREVDNVDGAAQKRHVLTHLASDLDFKVEKAMRAWSMIDARVAVVQTEVDRRRFDYLKDLFVQLGVKNKTLAKNYALVELAVFIGFEFLQGVADASDAQNVAQLLERLLPEN